MNLKYIIHCFIFLGTLYSQCESYNIEECFDDPYCIWEENLVLQNCDSQQDELVCNSINECSWEIQTTYYSCSNFGSSSSCSEYSDYGCSWEWSWGGWGNHGSSCAGGGFQIDNSICGGQDYIIDEGICILDLPPECSEMSESQCDDDFSCDWIVDIDVGSCYSLTQNQCNSNSNCNWDCGFYHGSCAGCCWYECSGGAYQTDNSYCEENNYNIGDINNDFEINVLDIIQTVNLILFNEYNIIVDMNNDEIINIQDVILLINLIL